jgi:bifunctional non-homologous end joining protein LigD
VGKVGTGLDDATAKELYGRLKSLQPVKRPVKEKPLDDATSVWVQPKLMCEVQYSSWTNNGMLREPVFLSARPDLDEVTA